MSLTISKATQQLVLPPLPAFKNMFPNAPQLPDGRMVIPHAMGEFMLLKHMGMTVSHPMLEYYDWDGGKPFDVQRQTCAMMTTNPRSYVLNDMGTGKTRAALWSWDYLKKIGYAKKVLIVAPLSTIRFVWGREIFGTLPSVKVAFLHGTRKQRLDLLSNQETEIFVINHDGLRVIYDELLARTDIDTLILDETSVYRNNSDRSKMMRKFAQRFNWVWGMTGQANAK